MVYRDGNKGLDKIYLIVGENGVGNRKPGVRLVHIMHMKHEFAVFGYGVNFVCFHHNGKSCALA